MMILIAAAICIMSQVSCQAPKLSEVLTQKGLTTLASALNDNSLMTVLEGLDAVTLFAPSNDAFTAAGTLPTGDALVAVLKYHALAASVQSTGITNNLQAETLNDMESGGKAKIRFNIYDQVYTAQGAVIDTSTGMVNIEIANGYVHIVNSVLSPPAGNIYQATADAQFSKLRGAIDLGELKATLEGEGPFTVFAPNNDATNSSILDSTDKATVAKLLKYHVVSGTVFSAGLKNDDQFTTVEGSKIKIIIDGSKVYVNSKDSAEVVKPDVSVTNGVVHVINAVLTIEDTSGSATTICSIVTVLCAALFATLSVQ